ncbi:eukaryotic translation initiation factor 3 subunit 10, putative [Theileria annulata]|uniref:Eukaryotic translation initiation factor 3 subunit A n=1 Tax=Theileria annulata TaxID=5874 RepID=Q4UGH6_THEAN|nr:eukaryotic translation initiation factor 3 subunit 10, putative [Theileria annulata]CAI73813.1 eukaryotic translation initiation factor 3 subunit 10, putative [Theileria annulata]|eukprot:XP_954490.1 eukaryotic translation initiation factor 3 subunit 10, putative [Theileria annulata]
MYNFQKPENALKRAAELRAIGQSDEALVILHSAIGHRFFRIQGWDMVQEQIMLEYVALCIDQDKLRLAREGLHQYRLISQHANVSSLAKVIVELLDRAENRLVSAKSKLQVSDAGKSQTQLSGGIVEEGMEYDETPEGLMASTLQVEMRDQCSKTLHDVYRFLWEIYKMILDISRATPKLEKVYHETARKAITFCRENARLVEFKRLCDVMRGHYSFLLKVQNKPEMECMLKPELHIETRVNQLITACELGMWKEAFNTVEDLYTLGIRDYITKTFQGSVSVLGQQKEKLLKWLAIFYEKLALIFWASDLLLFHALAVLRYVMHIRMYKKKVTEEEITYLCSKCVLAVLSVPNHALSQSSSTASSTAVYEMQKRMSTLLGYNTIPTKESLHHSLALKNVLPLAHKNVQKLYELVENDSSMKLCQQLVVILNDSNNTEGDLTDSKESETKSEVKTGTDTNKQHTAGQNVYREDLEKYYEKVKSVVFHKVLTRLSKVYASMTIDFFTKSICPADFYTWDYAEKEIVELVHRGLCHVRFDYTNRVLYFNSSSANADSIASIRHQLTDLGKNLYYVIRILSPADVNKSAEHRRLHLVSMKNSIEKERSRLMKRTSEIYQRRQEHQEEQMRVEEERKKQELQQKINEEKAEKERREEAFRQLELQRKKDERYKIKSDIANQMLQELRKLCLSSSSKIYIKGKGLDEYTVDDLIEGLLEYEDLEKAQEEHMVRERQELQKQRRNEVRKVEHFLRAVREADKQLYDAYLEELVKNDTALLLEVQKSREDKYKQDAEAMRQEKILFKSYAAEKQQWVEKQLVSRKKDFQSKLDAQNARFKKMLLEEKIARAKMRYNQEQMRLEQKRKEEQLKLEQKRKEEEMRLEQKRKEEEMRKRREQELHRQRLDEIAEIQRQKQLEIERRLAATNNTVTVNSGYPYSNQLNKDVGRNYQKGLGRELNNSSVRDMSVRDSSVVDSSMRDNVSVRNNVMARNSVMRHNVLRENSLMERNQSRRREYSNANQSQGSSGFSRHDPFNRNVARNDSDVTRADVTRAENKAENAKGSYGEPDKPVVKDLNRNTTDDSNWRSELKKTTSKLFKSFAVKSVKSTSDDEGNWRT